MSAPSQLTLGLGLPPALGRDDFVVGACNREALAAIDSWPDWPNGMLLLSGPQGSGKTHLTSIWSEASGAPVVAATALAGHDWRRLVAAGPIAVEDIDRAPEAAIDLFHLVNELRSLGGSLLMTARTADPARWTGLADLISRLRLAQPVTLREPDDAFLRMVLVKLFADRQLAVAPALLDFLVRRMERSFAAAARIVDRIDRLALSTGKAPGRQLAGEALAAEPGFAAPAGTAEAK